MVSQPSSSLSTVAVTVKPTSRFTSGPAIVAYVAAAKLLFHLLTITRYGIFRDEMYYFACSEHMAWGYVDQPPLIALVIWLTRHTLGSSVFALRLPAALAGSALVWLTGKLARELGGERFAQALAALAVFMVPIYMIMHHWITMNAFEPLIWMGCLWCVIRAINSGDDKYWFWFGVLAGVGFEAKYSIVFLLLGVLIGVVVTPERRILKSKWLWLGALTALLMFLPNFIWLVRHDFPFIELMHNIRSTSRDVVRGPVAFVLDQGQIMNPILFPLWLAGLAWLLFAQASKRYRVLGWTYVAVLGTFIALKGKNYYVAPIYPVLFAAGAVAFEHITSKRMIWTRAVYVAVLVLCTAVLTPLFAPVLPVESFIRYQRRLGIEPPKAENQNNGALPQYFADEFGWEDMVRDVARIYNSLPAEERARTAIFANSYGQAGAIDYFGPKYGLPNAISNHQSYWYWGPRDYTGDIVIVLGSDGTGDRKHFKSVEVAGRADNPYSRVDERYNIFLCRGLLRDFKSVWPKMKKWG